MNKDRLSIIPVPAPQITMVWPVAEPFIRRLCDGRLAGRFVSSDILEQLVPGHMQLWLVQDQAGETLAVLVTEIVSYPRSRWVRVLGCAGDRLCDWIGPAEAGIMAWARHIGARGAEIIGRKGWLGHLPGARLTAVMLEQEV